MDPKDPDSPLQIPQDCKCDYLSEPFELSPLGTVMLRRRYRQPNAECKAQHSMFDLVVDELPIFGAGK